MERKRVILTLMLGSFEQGFPALLRIKADGGEAETQVVGHLPPAPHMHELFKQWQLAYRQIAMPHSRLEPKPAQVTNISHLELGLQLTEGVNSWLNSGSSGWQKIRDRLQQSLNEKDEIVFIIETDNRQLRQLPWHLWDLFSRDYKQAEVALSVPEYQSLKVTAVPHTHKVRILAILGNTTGIDAQQDRAILEQLPQADINFLVKPQRQALTKQLWEQQWDILFFAGHSYSQADGSSGQICINQVDSLSITELKHSLRKSIERGLQIAIFNSCDGLGLARELAELHIPQIVVMREPVPDLVAQEFLQHFLFAFAQGKSLYLAVREARERLQGLEDRFPYATWLPVICQNPAEVPLTWQELCSRTKSTSARHQFKQRGPQNLLNWSHLKTVVLASVGVTALVMGVRYLGILQPLELQAFDQIVRLRPDETPDPRIIVVSTTENDIKAQDPKLRRGSISDYTLNKVLELIEQNKPRVVGLDIYRDFPSERADLANRLRSDRLIAVCKASDTGSDDPGVSPPPEVTADRQGFSDFIKDPDGVVRRHLLAVTSDAGSPCTASYAFSVQLAFRYLAASGILPKSTPDGFLQLGSVVFKPLDAHTAGYQQVDTWGHQVLLNYRSPHSPKNIAAQISLMQFLRGHFNPKLIKDRIVIIGTTANSFGDLWNTPFGSGQQSTQEMPGVLVQVQMVSQILSAVLDRRPLVWAWPIWGEGFWILGWSLIGGILAGSFGRSLRLGLVSGIALGVLYGLCFELLVLGAWVPLVPSAIAFVITSGTVIFCARCQSSADDSQKYLDRE